MNRYTILKVLCFFYSVLFAIGFLLMLVVGTQFEHYVIGAIASLVPSILLLKLGLWASKKEKTKNLEVDPDYYSKKSELKEAKVTDKINKIKTRTETSYKNNNSLETNTKKSQEKETDKSYNPKFHRTESEKELDFNFFFKYKNEIEKYENLIYAFMESNFIEDTVKSILAFDDFKKFCFSKGKGGKLYFEDSWLNCHNSNNARFSYRDRIVENLDNIYEYCLELPTANLYDYLCFESLKVDELKNLLRENNLKLSGKKTELIDRLITNNINPTIDSITKSNLDLKEDTIRKNLDYITDNKELINSLILNK